MLWLYDKWYDLKLDILRAHKSLTMWFNGLIGSLLAFWPFLADNIASLQPYLSDGAYKWIAGVLVAGNIVLRFKTQSALKDK